jgi:DNA-directed RNA polymerase subunit F
MKEILGKAKTVRELLKGVKYSIDYYQREYKWHEKQIRELVDDLRGSWGSDMTIDLLEPVALLAAIASVH